MSSLNSQKYRDLIKRLIKARKEAGLTQVEVAERLKRPQSYISKVETHQRRLDVLELIELLEIYSVDLGVILSKLKSV